MKKIATVDIGGTYTRLGIHLIDENRVCNIMRIETPDSRSSLMRILKSRYGAMKDIEGFAIAVAGTVEGNRFVNIAPSVDWLSIYPLADEVSREFLRPCWLCNDMYAAAVGEAIIAAETEPENFLLVTLSTGIGASLVEWIDSRTFSIENVEIGHRIHPLAVGNTCRCGKRACLESRFSGWAIEEEIRSMFGEYSSHLGNPNEFALRQAKNGEQWAAMLFESVGTGIGGALGGLLKTHSSIDRVVYMGGVGLNCMHFMRRALESEIVSYIGESRGTRLILEPSNCSAFASHVGLAAGYHSEYSKGRIRPTNSLRFVVAESEAA